MDGTRTEQRTIEVDAHVHLYDVFDRAALFARLAREASRRGRPMVLALAESEGYRAFAALAGDTGGAYAVRETDDPLALRIDAGEGGEVYVVSGRQLVSSERLEVLALGLGADAPIARVADGDRSAEALVAGVLEADAVCVLPWSVGKWLGERGRLVERLAAHPDFREHLRLFAGDIAARSWPWPRPGVFDGRLRVLCGTDPLPVTGAESGIARYRSCVTGAWSGARPWTSLCSMLESADRVEVAGKRDDLVRALGDQIRVRIVRRT